MSKRTVDAIKAIRLAWEKEQELVREGKGTRDWTREQQQDILNPDKGKAYDDKGRAFDGQHMKSVVEYPDYQGNPDNIQFLTREEHLEAHKGCWQNPTNWYFNPVTKEFIEFGYDEIIPCNIIELSDSIVVLRENEYEEKNTDMGSAENKTGKAKDGLVTSKSKEEVSIDENKQYKSADKMVASKIQKMPKSEKRVINGLKTVGGFVVAHPAESLEIAKVVFGSARRVVSAIRGKRNKTIYKSNLSTSSDISNKADVVTKVADIVERVTKSSSSDNVVPGHGQHYHTKNGVIWREKAPYHRKGKDG